MVKKFDRMGDASLSIFICMNRQSYTADQEHRLEDLAVEAAASLVYIALRDNVPVRVFSEPLERGSLNGTHLRDYRSLMDELITPSPKGKEPFADYVRYSSYYLPGKSTIYLFTPHLDMTAALTIFELKRRGFYPNLFYLSFEDYPPAAMGLINRLKDSGIRAYTLHPAEGVEHVNQAL